MDSLWLHGKVSSALAWARSPDVRGPRCVLPCSGRRLWRTTPCPQVEGQTGGGGEARRADTDSCGVLTGAGPFPGPALPFSFPFLFVQLVGAFGWFVFDCFPCSLSTRIRHWHPDWPTGSKARRGVWARDVQPAVTEQGTQAAMCPHPPPQGLLLFCVLLPFLSP